MLSKVHEEDWHFPEGRSNKDILEMVQQHSTVMENLDLLWLEALH